MSESPITSHQSLITGVESPVTKYDSEIVATLTSALPDVIAIYRFGSHGSVMERPDSDIDLAILGRVPFDFAALWDLSQRLAIKLGREVDLVDLAAASTVLQAQIITGGERLFCSDSVYSDSYGDYILSAYAHLNEERRGILSDVLSRGSVYGGRRLAQESGATSHDALSASHQSPITNHEPRTTAVIERCLKRIGEEYQGHEGELETNFTRQDAIILNLLRACEASLDAAMHIIRQRRMGLPQESRDAFSLL